jgi:predicted ATPase
VQFLCNVISFFRAEDFFGYIKRIKSEAKALEQLENEYFENFTGYAKLLTMGVPRGQRSVLEAIYGKDSDGFSHGERFLTFFESRVLPNGLYILDEPEIPHSPQRQLAMLV